MMAQAVELYPVAETELWLTASLYDNQEIQARGTSSTLALLFSVGGSTQKVFLRLTLLNRQQVILNPALR
jgi:hypothetical protein